MQPETPMQNFTPEQAPVKYGQNVEYAPNVNNQEAGVEKSAEFFEQRAEAKAIAGDVSSTTILPPPVIQDEIVKTNSVVIGDTPSLANDDDVIEKEWVDKAKRIVAETKDDPYRREEAVNKLQADYLKKRFGKELGAA